MAKAKKVRIVVTKDGGSGVKAKGQRHDATLIVCHSKKFFRCRTAAGKLFHIAVDSASVVGKVK